MWHKLKETFAYKDSKNRQTENTDDQVVKKNRHQVIGVSTEQSEINVQKENSSVREPVNVVSSQTVSQPDTEQSSGNVFTYLNKKLDEFVSYHEGCFGCRVTASVVTLGMVVLLGTRLVSLKPEMPRNKHIFVYTANLSLFGMWVAFMKNEWYDEKETPDVQKESSK